ncbi:GIY-YIG nuclease family protein [Cupriavidus taiwanensis]|uniref:GIY-YIG nuclease family protein n=1 Tax=Cupriavidus taiwanensis TaxID=164546 RepID=UPI000E1ABC14|nr:GIY-YIG nuclease family protein [Cupriavidus taiwanensis]SPA26899.1 conserved hypothetical protein [Cupriavidus taiwanensis]
MSNGKSIKLFLADGTPGGIITAEIMNWSGHVLAAPRSRLADLLQRPEASRPGLYVLVGEKPDGDEPLAYIGETESIAERLTQQARPEDKGGKDFWHRAFVITSKDANLTKGHLRFLESRLISIALSANRISLINSKGTQSEYGMLPEADRADMLYFIEQIRLVLPVLGLDLLREAPPLLSKDDANHVIHSPLFSLTAPKLGIVAKAQEVDGEFVVQTGSLAKATWTETKGNEGYRKLHQQLQEHGVLVPANGNLLSFSSEYAFSSPSAASAVIMGRADNGRTSWKLQGSTLNYGEWQTQQLEAKLLNKTVS